MINEAIFIIKKDEKLYEYLKYHSYWYSRITYNKDLIKEMVKEMKIELKETVEDKIIDFSKKLELVSSFLDVLS